MAKKRNTKLALASLMAVSAIAPVVASADTNGSVTTEAVNTSATVTKTIDFTVQEETGMLARFVKGPGTLVERSGQQYIQLNLTDAVLGMVTAVTVDGKTALHEFGGKKVVLIPVTAEYAPVVVDFAINSPAGAGEYKATLTPDKSSIKEVKEEAKAEETVKTPTTDVKLESLKNGEYYVSFTTLKPDSNEASTMSNHIGNVVKLIVKDGTYTAQLTIAPESNPMVSSIQSTRDGKLVEMDVVSGGRDKESRVVSFPIASLQDKLRAHVVVEVPANPAMPKGATMPHDFDVVFGEVKTEAPVAEEKPTTEKPVEEKPTTETTETTNTTDEQGEEVPVYVYKDGEKELSIMAGVYLSNTATVTDKGIDVVFPQGQYLKGFEVEGATVALKSEEVVGDNTVKIYTIQTQEPSKIYTATVDVKVNVSGVNYDTKHKVQLQFGGKQNPFTDIQKLDNYSAIVNLYSAGIFKENEKFNPHNPTTRSQFSLMLYRALEVEVPATTAFKDIAKLDAEAQSAIKALNGLGVINGVNKETFAPYNNITRAQTAKMIYRLLVSFGYQDQANATVPFSDVTANDAELNKAAAQLNALGIMTGSNGKLNPNAPLTRNQMAKVLNNALEVLVGLE